VYYVCSCKCVAENTFKICPTLKLHHTTHWQFGLCKVSSKILDTNSLCGARRGAKLIDGRLIFIYGTHNMIVI